MSHELHRYTQVALNRSRVIGRRDFLRGISVAGLATGTLGWTDHLAANAAELRKRGKACILLWMQGGPSQFETFSPKPGHANGGETKAIATNVPGIQIADNFPQLAQMMNHAAVLRGMTSKEGSHPRATYLLHTGYLPTASIKYPTLGSLVSHEIAPPNQDLPSFVRIGGGRGLAGGGGFLGVQRDPFDISNPNAVPNNTRPTTDVPRYQERLKLLGQLQEDFAKRDAAAVEDHRRLYDRAAQMILSTEMKAFDLAQEPESLRSAYGKTQFGSGCLLARRLIEAGVTFVEVVLNGWDTHDDNFARVKTLAGQLDQPFAQLLKDLGQRGMLDSTLVLWMGEFGRTPKINPRGGRDHYPRAFNVLLAGAGIRGGQVIGETDPSGATVEKRPITVPDLFQTVCKSLGIDGQKENMSAIGRPIKVADGGTPVDELF